MPKRLPGGKFPPKKEIKGNYWYATLKGIRCGYSFLLLDFGCKKGCKSCNLLIYTLVCGERGI